MKNPENIENLDKRLKDHLSSCKRLSKYGKCLYLNLGRKGHAKSNNGKVIFVIVGSSGTGKSDILTSLIDSGVCIRARTATSRLPRESELALKEDPYIRYPKLTKKAHAKESLKEWIKRNRLIEGNIFGGEFYGLPIESLSKGLKKARPIAMILEWNGVRSLKSFLKSKEVAVISIFVVPDSYSEAINRISDRNDSKDRIAQMPIELDSAIKEADFFLVNQTVKNSTYDLSTSPAAVALRNMVKEMT